MGASKETVCDRCGRPRRIIFRSGARSLCGSCYNVSPDRPRRRCGRCNKVAAICVRATSTSPDICVDCYELPLATCSSCGRHRPCQFVRAPNSDVQEVPSQSNIDLCSLRRGPTSSRELGRRPGVRHLLHRHSASAGNLQELRGGAAPRLASRARIDDVL